MTNLQHAALYMACVALKNDDQQLNIILFAGLTVMRLLNAKKEAIVHGYCGLIHTPLISHLHGFIV